MMRRVIAVRDQHAFRHLVDRYKAMGMTLAVRVLSDEMLAEEALQDAFLRVWRSAHTFTFNASFKTWFYRILYNAALTKRKSERVTEQSVALDEQSGIHHATGFDTAISSRETTQIVLESIERLPQAQRTVLTLYYLQELSIEEIAEVTSMPSGTIKTHLFRGRNSLRNDVSLKAYVNP
jgi:RNA polymerase sigma factor (sigma-70 family)